MVVVFGSQRVWNVLLLDKSLDNLSVYNDTFSPGANVFCQKLALLYITLSNSCRKRQKQNIILTQF